MYSNNISFTSKINIVPPQIYHQLWRGKEITCDPKARNVIEGKDLYTYGVRTCSAGGITSDTHRRAIGFHIMDIKDNIDNIKYFIDRITLPIFMPRNCLLVGSKTLKGSPYSTIQFQKLKEAFTKRYHDISIMEEFTDESGEMDMYYSLEQDTWFLSITHQKQPVKSVEQLKQCFKNVHIAKNDTLYIYDTKVDFPD